MQDRFGRKIEYIRVSVTDRCNLRCVYCMPAEGAVLAEQPDILTYDEIARFCRIASATGISRIKLTGGEPLVRKGLPVLAGKLKQIPGIEQVTLTTNGTLLKKQIRELAERGLDAVNISLDTLDEKKYAKITRGGSLMQVKEGILAALSCPGLPVKINCVPLKETEEEELVQIARMAEKFPLDVRFIEMMPIGLGKDFFGKSSDEIKAILENRFGSFIPYQHAVGNGPAEYVTFSGFRGRIGFISAMTHRFCSTCNRIRLTAEGMLKPCLQYKDGTDIRKLLRCGAEDREIEEAIRQAVMKKPACHRFCGDKDQGPQEGLPENREMFRIGG